MEYRTFADLMRELANADDPAAVIRRYAHQAGFLTGVTGDQVDLLQRALAIGDQHPITQAAERWLADEGFDRPYFRLSNRHKGMGPQLARLAFPKFGRTAVATNGDIVVTAEGRTIAVYGADGTLHRTFKARHVEGLGKLAIHPDGRRLLAGNGYHDDKIRVYDLEQGKQLAFFGIESNLCNFVLLPDGKRALGGNHALSLWNVESPRRKPIWSVSHAGTYDVVALHPNGEWSVSRTYDRFEIHLIEDGSLVREVPLAVADPDRYDSMDQAALVLPDGRALFVVDSSAGVIEVFDLESGALLESLTGHTKPVTALAISPNGKLFASVSEDGYVRVWDTNTLGCVWTVRAHEAGASGVAFFSDDAVVSVGGDGMARLWDIEPGNSPPDREPPIRHAVLVGDSVYTLHADGILREWAVATHECVRQLRLPEAAEGEVLSWYWSAQNSLLLAVGSRIYRCDLETGEIHQFYVSSAERVLDVGPVLGDKWYLNEEPGGLARFDITPTLDVEARTAIAEWVNYEVVGDRWLVKKFSTVIGIADTTDEMPEFRRLHQITGGGTFRAVAEYREKLFAAVSDGAQIRVFRLPDGALIGQFGQLPVTAFGSRAIAFSTDGTAVYTTDPDRRLLETTIETGETRSWHVTDAQTHELRVTSPNTVAMITEESVNLVKVDSGDIVLHWPVQNPSLVGIRDDMWILLVEGELVFLKASPWQT